jgi:hypothetical protein
MCKRMISLLKLVVGRLYRNRVITKDSCASNGDGAGTLAHVQNRWDWSFSIKIVSDGQAATLR